jgi:hypothetical protein
MDEEVSEIAAFKIFCGRVEKLIGCLRKSSAMKMAMTQIKNVIDVTTIKMAKSKRLKIKMRFFE